MKFPKSVKILNTEYKIILCNPRNVLIPEEDLNEGVVDFDRRELKLLIQQPERMLAQFIHEIIHIIADDLNINLENENQNEETAICALSHLLTQTLLDAGFLESGRGSVR